MPLHLLGKKSWNVYNASAISRVRADEAALASAQDSHDALLDARDAARRTALLRGEAPPVFEPLPPSPTADTFRPPRPEDKNRERGVQRARSKRKRGEDDTDAAIRRAREDAEFAREARERLAVGGTAEDGHGGASARASKDVPPPIVDAAGHIQLFAAPGEAATAREEAARKRALKQREDEEAGAMKFSDASGYGKTASSAPWYARRDGDPTAAPAPSTEGTNAFGRPDPRRADRDKARVSASDPFAAMQRAQGQLKQAERERERWAVEKARELRALDEEMRHGSSSRKSSKHKDRSRRREQGKEDRRERTSERRRSADSLEGFALDAEAAPAASSRHGHERGHIRSSRDRSRDGEQGRPRRRHRSERSRSRERKHRSPDRREQRRRSRSPRRSA